MRKRKSQRFTFKRNSFGRRLGFRKFSLLYAWLLSYLSICIILSCCSMFLYSSLTQTAQEYVRQSHMENLDKIAFSTDHTLALANNFYTSLSANTKISNLIFDDITTEIQDELSIQLGQELKRLLSTTDFSGAYIYFQSGDFVVSHNQKDSSKAFFNFFYHETDLSYENWLTQMQTPNFGNYISVKDADASYIDVLYQLPRYGDNTFVHATLAVRISDTILKKSFGSELKSIIAVLDRDNRLIMKSTANPLALLNYDDYTDGIITTDKNTVTLCQTSSYNSWKYLYIFGNTEFYKKVKYTARTNMIFILMSLFLCCGLGIYFSFKNYRPLNELIKMYRKQSGMPDNTHLDHNVIKNALQDYVTSKRKLNHFEYQQQRSSANTYLHELLRGSTPSAKPDSINFPSDLYSVILFRPYHTEALFDDDISSEERTTENTIFFITQNVMEELLNQEDFCRIIKSDDCTVAIYCCSDEQSAQIYKTGIYSAVSDGMSFIKSNFGFGFDVGVSSVRKGAASIPLAYNEAQLALTFRPQNTGEIVFYDEIYLKNLTAETSFYNSFTDKKDALLKYIAQGDINAALEILDVVFHQCISSLSVEKAKITLFSLENSIVSTMNFNNSEKQPNIINEILLSINSDNMSVYYDSMRRLIEHVCSIQENTEGNLCEAEDSLQSATTENLLPQIIDYIRANYTDMNLSLSSIGEVFNISSYYLSRVFKNTTGEPLTDFIAHLRVDKAKILLETTDLPISKICEQSGFASEKTFTRTFSKYESITPGKYRKRVKR